MNLDRERCYRASLSCDPRFDGRFFLAVRTTGIYCRPVCPAPTPRRENVEFFGSAVAAEAAGFRPCLRCRPESAPAYSNGTSGTVRRAMRLIADGWVDRHGVDALAARLGVGTRHLRRLFREHVGATPISVAQTRRLHFAKKLLDETSWPMTAIAAAAGFSSVRRFNEAVRTTWGRAPSALRRRKAAGVRIADSRLELRLAYRPPLDWPAALEFLAAREVPRLETIDGERYSRTVRVGPRRGTIDVAPAGDGACELMLGLQLDGPAPLMPVVARVRRMFDLDADVERIDEDLSRDPALVEHVRCRPGMRLAVAWDPFELIVRAIVGQRISVTAARTVVGRVVESHGEPLGDRRLFPTEQALADARIEECGLPGARASAIRDVSRAVLDGTLAWDDPPSALERLGGIRGVGPWTVQYVAMRAFAEPDAFPAGDLVLKKILGLAEAELERRSAAWRPWRAYAALHLWRGQG